MNAPNLTILVLYYSRNGSTRRLAESIKQETENVPGCDVRLRTVPALSTLLSMMIPLLHHGMLLLGIPYTHPDLMTAASGGTPYGASHWSGADSQRTMSGQSRAIALGKRLGGYRA